MSDMCMGDSGGDAAEIRDSIIGDPNKLWLDHVNLLSDYAEERQSRLDLAHELDSMRRERDLALEKRYQRELALDYQKRYQDLVETVARREWGFNNAEATATSILRDNLNLQAKVEEQHSHILDLQEALIRDSVARTKLALECGELLEGRAELEQRMLAVATPQKQKRERDLLWQAAAVISSGAWVAYAIARAALA